MCVYSVLNTVQLQILVVEKFSETLEICLKLNLRDKNFVIASTFRDSVLLCPLFRYELIKPRVQLFGFEQNAKKWRKKMARLEAQSCIRGFHVCVRK